MATTSEDTSTTSEDTSTTFGSTNTALDSTSTTFEDNYASLLKLSDKSADSEYLTLLKPYLTDFKKVFNFSVYKEVNESSNHLIFTTLSKRLSNVLNDINNNDSEPLIRGILCAYRILLRSKVGLKPLLTQSFHEMLITCLSHFVNNKDIQTQCLACIINLCVVSLKRVCKITFKLKSYNEIIKFLMNNIDNNDQITDKEKDTLRFLGIHCLFYFTANLDDKSIAKDIYTNDAFFRWIYSLYLKKSQYFENPNYWTKTTNSPTTKDENKTDNSKNDFGNSDWREDCSLINEICRLLFNFTLVENKVLQYKLDKFEREFQFAVVNRTCDILSIPLSYDVGYKKYAAAKSTNNLTIKEYQKQVGNWSKCSQLCDQPSLISVKLNLCNVAMYNGDIIGMNLKPKCCQSVAELLDFRAIVTRDGYKHQESLCPMLMFLKDVLSFNSTVRAYLKKYVFKSDAEPSSDSDSDDNDDSNANPRNPDIKSKLDKVPKGGTTLRNLFISYMTSVSYSVKTAMGEFFLQVCDNSPDEMIRLVGFGAGIGHLVNKGVPGYSQMANQGVNLEQMAALKRKREKEAKAKEEKDRNEKKETSVGSSSNEKSEKSEKKKKEKQSTIWTKTESKCTTSSTRTRTTEDNQAVGYTEC